MRPAAIRRSPSLPLSGHIPEKTMKKLISVFALAVSLLLLSGVAEAWKKKVVEDPLIELDKEDYGVSLTRSRALYDYQAAEILKNADPSMTRILVTTTDMMPDGRLYSVAEAISESLKAKFPLTEFRVIGRTDLDEFVQMIRENYDYMFVVGTNFESDQYDSEQTVYSSRSTGVRCTPAIFGGGVNCNESSSASVPIGTRPVKRSIATDIFYVHYGSAKDATKAFSTVVKTQISKWGVSNSRDIGNTSISLRYGTSDASWCESTVGAQTFLARMVGGNLVSTKPDEFSITVAPDEIGCED